YYINGAPLPSLESNAPSLSVLEPEGFQPLEELLFDDAAMEQKEKLTELGSELENRFKEFVAYQQGVQVYDRHVFEAVRFELIRVFTMGITGFDSPVTLNSIPESAAALEACWWL